MGSNRSFPLLNCRGRSDALRALESKATGGQMNPMIFSELFDYLKFFGPSQVLRRQVIFGHNPRDRGSESHFPLLAFARSDECVRFAIAYYSRRVFSRILRIIFCDGRLASRYDLAASGRRALS